MRQIIQLEYSEDADARRPWEEKLTFSIRSTTVVTGAGTNTSILGCVGACGHPLDIGTANSNRCELMLC